MKVTLGLNGYIMCVIMCITALGFASGNNTDDWPQTTLLHLISIQDIGHLHYKAHFTDAS